MKRLLLDTNIYGLLAADPELLSLKSAYQKKKQEFLIYGFALVRKELRETPKSKSVLGKNLRIAMLCLYDEFVSTHNVSVPESQLAHVAFEYYETYKKLGGSLSQEALLKDYMIVAAAALKQMDIVVSHDHATMLSDFSLKSYELVNAILHLKNPAFLDYDDFKNLLSR